MSLGYTVSSSPSQSTPLLKSARDDDHHRHQDAAATAADDDPQQRPAIGSGSGRRRRIGGFSAGVFRPFCAELVATSLFVFVGTMAVQTRDFLLIALAHGLTVALLVVAFNDVR